MSGSDPVCIKGHFPCRVKGLQIKLHIFTKAGNGKDWKYWFLILLFLEIVLDMYSETYFPWDRTLYFLPERCLKDVFGKDCFSDVMEIKSIEANFYLSLPMNIAWWACRPATKWGSGLLLPAFPSFPLQPRLCRKALPKGRSKGGTCSEMTSWETYCLAKRCRGNRQEEEWYT